MSIKQAIKSAQQQLVGKTDTPDLDAEILLAHVLQQPRTYLRAWPEKELSLEQIQQFEDALKRHCLGEPVAYITGIKEFWSLPLKVTPDTLIPRPETELLVEIILQRFAQQSQLTLADLGTGSGAISIALAHERPEWKIHATDNKPEALAVAQENAQRLGLRHIIFYHGDWLAALPKQKFDLIVSNPPYISEGEWESYSHGLSYEPATALLSKNNGLADIEKIISTAVSYLKTEGYLIFEHGFAQAEAVRSLFASYGYSSVESIRDLMGHDRLTLGRWIVV